MGAGHSLSASVVDRAARFTACKAAVDECAKGKLDAGEITAVKSKACETWNPPPPPPPSFASSSVPSSPESSAATATAFPRGAATAWKDVDGAGQTVGITAFDTFLPSDVADYLELFGMPDTMLDNLSQVHVNGGAALGPNQSEVLLDVDTVLNGRLRRSGGGL